MDFTEPTPSQLEFLAELAEHQPPIVPDDWEPTDGYGVPGVNKGIPMSEEQKKKISKALKGNTNCLGVKKPEFAEKMRGRKKPKQSVSMKKHWVKRHEEGWTMSQEARDKIAKTLTGFKHTDETKRKCSEAGKKGGRPKIERDECSCGQPATMAGDLCVKCYKRNWYLKKKHALRGRRICETDRNAA